MKLGSVLRFITERFNMKYSPKWFYIFQSPVDERMYLGQTTQKLNIDYFGSGNEWRKHIEINGNPLLIYSRWCNTSSEFQKQLNIVESEYGEYWLSPEWFNAIPESPGDGLRHDPVSQSILGKKGGKASQKTLKKLNKGLYSREVKSLGGIACMQSSSGVAIREKGIIAAAKKRCERSTVISLWHPLYGRVTANTSLFRKVFGVCVGNIKRVQDGKTRSCKQWRKDPYSVY